MGVLRGRSFADFPAFKQFIADSRGTANADSSIPLQNAWVTLCVQEGTSESNAEAKATCDRLAQNLDTMRAKYWTYRKGKIP